MSIGCPRERSRSGIHSTGTSAYGSPYDNGSQSPDTRLGAQGIRPPAAQRALPRLRARSRTGRDHHVGADGRAGAFLRRAAVLARRAGRRQGRRPPDQLSRVLRRVVRRRAPWRSHRAHQSTAHRRRTALRGRPRGMRSRRDPGRLGRHDPRRRRRTIIDVEHAWHVSDTFADWDSVDLRRTDGGTLAAIMYTSGTTSRPKGVMVTHAAYLNAGDVVAGHLRLRRYDRNLIVLPLFHGNAQYYSTMSAFVSGASVALTPGSVPADGRSRRWPPERRSPAFSPLRSGCCSLSRSPMPTTCTRCAS